MALMGLRLLRRKGASFSGRTLAASVAPPRFVEFSANNHCNLRCAFCYGAGKPAPKTLTENEHQRLLDELLPEADILMPSAGSEPFLGGLERAVAAAERHNARLLLITSGYYLTREWVERLAPLLFRLQISLDSHRRETHELLRAGSNLGRVRENLKTAATVLRERGLAHRLVISAVATAENFAHLPEMIGVVREWGAEAFLIQKLYGATGKFGHLALETRYSAEEIAGIRSEIEEASRRSGAEVMFGMEPLRRVSFRPENAPPIEWDPEYTLDYVRSNPGGCYQAHQWTKIDPEGNVYPCCVAPPDLAMGNIRERSFPEIYRSRKWRALREGFESGRLPECCESCELRAQYADFAINVASEP